MNYLKLFIIESDVIFKKLQKFSKQGFVSFFVCKPPEERFFTRVQSVIPFTVTKPNVEHVLNVITVAK